MAHRLIYSEPERLMTWALERYPAVITDGDIHSMGLEIDGELIVVVLFNDFSRWNCSMHVVSDGSRRWCSRGFLAAAFAYPFVQLGLNRVTAYVPAKNIGAVVLDTKLGFRFEGRMAEALGDDDLIVLGMLRRDCNWLRGE